MLFFTMSLYSQTEKLIGKWGNCKSVCNGMTVMKNVCSEIEFKKNQTVVISNSGGIRENYKWKIKNNQIRFINLSRKKYATFSESKVYKLIFNKSSSELVISEKENGKCYDVLSRYSNYR